MTMFYIYCSPGVIETELQKRAGLNEEAYKQVGKSFRNG